MSIETQLIEIAENVPKVYNAGYEKGKAENDYYNTFWDALQDNGNRKNYQMAFAYGWNNKSFKPKYDITATVSATSLFQQCDIVGDLAQIFEDCGVVLDLAQAANAHSVYNSAARLTRVPETNITGAGAAATGVFAYCGQLKTIDKFVVNETNVFTSSFINCRSLASLTIEGTIASSIDLKSSPLTQPSLLSVTGALSETVTGQTCTLNKAAVNAAFETSPGANDGSASPAWLAITDRETGTRRNWAFALI